MAASFGPAFSRRWGLRDAPYRYSGFLEPSSDPLCGHTESLGDLRGGSPADVSRDKVVSVDAKPFYGYGYNLQTKTGRYIANGIILHNCADLISLQLRRLGKPVPKNNGSFGNFDGGTRSFRLRYASQMKPFKLSECREGDVPFVDFQTSWAPEGHIGFCLGGGPDAKFLQSHLETTCVVGEPGLNNTYTIKQSNTRAGGGNYYTHRLPREAIWG